MTGARQMTPAASSASSRQALATQAEVNAEGGLARSRKRRVTRGSGMAVAASAGSSGGGGSGGGPAGTGAHLDWHLAHFTIRPGGSSPGTLYSELHEGQVISTQASWQTAGRGR